MTPAKPKPNESPAPAPSAPQELMTGVPRISKLVWTLLPKDEAEAAAKELVEKATAFQTDRKARATWAPTRENALMAHIANSDQRADIAQRLLEEAGGITPEQVFTRTARNLMLVVAADVTMSEYVSLNEAH